ncbi:hypothetical protein [Nitrosopumilus maritimus]|nr:hypothetical protein [Nitrosopumilus maritimus]
MKNTILIMLLMLGSVFVMMTPVTVYSDSHVQTEMTFEQIMAIDVHENSVVVYAQTEIPVVCEVEYALNGDGFSNSMIVSHDSVPHTGHIVKIPELLLNTEYEYRYIGEISEEKITSEISSFTTI